MSHVADSLKNRLFDPISGRFTPIRPTNQRLEQKGRPTLWQPRYLVDTQRHRGVRREAWGVGRDVPLLAFSVP